MARRKKCICGCGKALPSGPGRWRYASPECRTRTLEAKADRATGEGGSPLSTESQARSGVAGTRPGSSLPPPVKHGGMSGAEKAPRRPPPVPGEVRVTSSGYEHVYLPDHPLAVKGWAGKNRVDLYEQTEGVCMCGVTGEQLEWSEASVIDQHGTLIALCGRHRQLRYIWNFIAARPTSDTQGQAPAEFWPWLRAWLDEPCGPAIVLPS